jgi:hypothetical protein
MRAAALAILGIFALVVTATVGCLEIDAANGTLVCSTVADRRCPRGYYCAPNNTCWHDGDTFPPDLSHPVDFAWAGWDFSAPPYDFTRPDPAGD